MLAIDSVWRSQSGLTPKWYFFSISPRNLKKRKRIKWEKKPWEVLKYILKFKELPTLFLWSVPISLLIPKISSVQFSWSVVSDSLQPHGLQHARLPYPSPTPGAFSNSSPLSRWCNPNISCCITPSPPTFILSQYQGLFHWVSSSHQVAKVLEFQLQHQSFQWISRTDFL